MSDGVIHQVTEDVGVLADLISPDDARKAVVIAFVHGQEAHDTFYDSGAFDITEEGADRLHLMRRRTEVLVDNGFDPDSDIWWSKGVLHLAPARLYVGEPYGYGCGHECNVAKCEEALAALTAMPTVERFKADESWVSDDPDQGRQMVIAWLAEVSFGDVDFRGHPEESFTRTEVLTVPSKNS